MEEALARSLRAPAPADQLTFAEQDHEERTGGTDALRAKLAGFSLHAGRWVPPEDREALERLCRYGLRAPFSQERLSRRADGKVVYELRRPWPHARGVTQLVLEPLELLRRLAALVPAPGRQMVRYHGCFANRSKLRPLLPAPPPRLLPQGVEPPAPENTHSADGARESRAQDRAQGRARLGWAQLLYRVLFLDALLCTKCGGRMKVLAFLSDPAVVARILQHLKIPATAPPLSPARACQVDPLWTDHEPWLDESEHDPTGRGRAPSPRAPP
jgi:hypothetical protein